MGIWFCWSLLTSEECSFDTGNKKDRTKRYFGSMALDKGAKTTKFP
jgi:hypothetical protein